MHGFGSTQSIWHHDKTGKLWISDSEFLIQFKQPLRVLSFNYNGDVAANMTAASLAFQAWELLGCLGSAMELEAVSLSYLYSALAKLSFAFVLLY